MQKLRAPHHRTLNSPWTPRGAGPCEPRGRGVHENGSVSQELEATDPAGGVPKGVVRDARRVQKKMEVRAWPEDPARRLAAPGADQVQARLREPVLAYEPTRHYGGMLRVWSEVRRVLPEGEEQRGREGREGQEAHEGEEGESEAQQGQEGQETKKAPRAEQFLSGGTGWKSAARKPQLMVGVARGVRRCSGRRLGPFP